ncbi:hypothetical protein [Prosthecobacter sp.]|uniref:hypothetical protein n=1 Tax=Prosthecobacter sp. TaxID=1965333 RepID=UPI003783EA89
MKTLICFTLFFLCQVSAAEPAIEALIADSPVIVVATPVFEKGMPPMGTASEITLVKYSVKFRIQKILKTDREMKVGDLIFTRLAVHVERPAEAEFQIKEGQSKILFLRKTSYEKDSFENTSIWFGVMPYTEVKEMTLGFDIKRVTDGKTK